MCADGWTRTSPSRPRRRFLCTSLRIGTILFKYKWRQHAHHPLIRPEAPADRGTEEGVVVHEGGGATSEVLVDAALDDAVQALCVLGRGGVCFGDWRVRWRDGIVSRVVCEG